MKEEERKRSDSCVFSQIRAGLEKRAFKRVFNVELATSASKTIGQILNEIYRTKN